MAVATQEIHRGLAVVMKTARRLNGDQLRKHWPKFRALLDPPEVDHLAVLGLIAKLNDARHSIRQGAGRVTNYDIVIVPNGKPAETLVVFAEVLHEGADGELKAVAYFTKEDCACAAKSMRREANGLRAKADWMEETRSVLVRYRKSMIKDLAIKVQTELAKKWQRVSE